MVGIGIELKFDDATGAADVTYALPGAPAERAGVLAGDRILNVNGKRFQGRAFVDMVNEIRGRVSAVNSIFIGASNQLGEFESGATAALLGPVGSVVMGGIGTLLIAAGWVRLFPSLARRDRMLG